MVNYDERWRKIPRKVHVTRIFGTNKKKEILHDIWVDVERFDNFTRHTQDTTTTFAKLNNKHHFQKVLAKFNWRDNPNITAMMPNKYRAEDDESEEEDRSSRATVVRKICSPDETDLEDPSEWVPVRCITRIRKRESENDKKDHMAVRKFLTKILKAARGNRKVWFRRIYHYETTIDKDVEKAIKEDPSLKAYVVYGYQYEKDLDSKDEEQYAEVELVKELFKRDNLHGMSNGSEQKTFIKFKNQYLAEESEQAKFKEMGENDINPPYRLDPFQNIINVNWTSLAVEFGDTDEDAPEPKK